MEKKEEKYIKFKNQIINKTTTKMAKMKFIDWFAIVFVLIGALNWGILGVTTWMNSPFNLVATIFGAVLTPWIYTIVGVAFLISLFRLFMK